MSAPRLIATWHIGPHAVPVYEHDEPIDPQQSLLGRADFSPPAIRIMASLQGAERWQVLLHELAHWAFFTVGNQDKVGAEVACDVIGTFFTQALGYLLHEPPGEIR